MAARDTVLDDLELSANTAAWLRSLGLKTVGELLDRPRLSPPHEFIETELAAHLEELGVEYEGEIVHSLASTDATT